MITIRNTQRKIALDVEALRQDAQKILDALKYSDFDLGILITSNRTIKNYNKTYRNKNKATDILSFPYHTELKAGQKIKAYEEEDKNLGDLIIAPEYIIKLISVDYDNQISLEKRLQTLLVHGICHLLGYDHILDSDYKQMHKKEKQLLKILS